MSIWQRIKNLWAISGWEYPEEPTSHISFFTRKHAATIVEPHDVLDQVQL